MKITFLGTSGGKPTRRRNCSAIALSPPNHRGWYLFDCAEGTQRQIMHSPLSAAKLRAIFVTHIHGDHCYGLPGLLSSMMLDRRTEPLTIYGPAALKAMMEAVVDVSYEHLGYEVRWESIYGGYEADIGPFGFTALPLIHSVETYAFLVQTPKRVHLDAEALQRDGLAPSPDYAALKRGEVVEANGRRYEPERYCTSEPPQRLIIAGDNAEPAILAPFMEDLDLLIHEATYTQADFDALPQKQLHTTARSLATAAQNARVRHLIATHISPRYDMDTSPLLAELKAHFAGPCYIADDFDTFELCGDGLRGPS